MRKNIAVCIVLSVVTCGIYSLYWLYTLANNTNELTGNSEGTSGGMVVLFSIITCSIYLLYWMYKTGNAYDEIDTDNGLPTKNRGILYLLLSVFGLSIVSMALIQNDINNKAID